MIPHWNTLTPSSQHQREALSSNRRNGGTTERTATSEQKKHNLRVTVFAVVHSERNML
jgi:hypothetical protein